MVKRFIFVYHFFAYNIVREVSFDGLKWCLFAYVQYPEGDKMNIIESRHFTKETLAREFYDKFPECRSSRLQSVTKEFTISKIDV